MKQEDSDLEEPEQVSKSASKSGKAKREPKPSLSRQVKEKTVKPNAKSKVEFSEEWGADANEHSDDIPPVAYTLKAPKALSSVLKGGTIVVNGAVVGERKGEGSFADVANGPDKAKLPVSLTSRIPPVDKDMDKYLASLPEVPPNKNVAQVSNRRGSNGSVQPNQNEMPGFRTPQVRSLLSPPESGPINASSIPSHGPDRSFKMSGPVAYTPEPSRINGTPQPNGSGGNGFVQDDEAEYLIRVFTATMRGRSGSPNNVTHAIGAVIAAVPDADRYFPLDDIATLITLRSEEAEIDWLLSKLRHFCLARESH